ncbi:predicted protein [Naegleria gruberi]|uniref:Predicted protein n=1 Tax=Naegleria gruberi TaxID=5762 RepID=D2V0J0_NAEGR|nr:uncharacterized protein NAEGRDRAFT_62312 [Naegleria gruberi]EFC49729.1 predicted protein [Naegleria gruberi]|eukprot:XP_002682473.1 predicted protein [Naegleria gruberi strain NEG-M]
MIQDDIHNNNLSMYHAHFPNSVSMKPFRTLHTGIIHDPDAVFERKKPLRLELRKSHYTTTTTIQKEENSPPERENTSGSNTSSQITSYPYTSILILDHVFHIAKLLNARHVHLKYVEQSGDTYIMFRTDQGLVPYSTIQNKHWIKYLLMHATGKEEYEKAGEGEFRLEVMTERDGRLDFTVNIVYIQGGVKLTLSFINV